MGKFFRYLDSFDRAIAAASGKYNTYAQGQTWNLPADLATPFSAAEQARETADQLLLAARHEGESARMAPVERAVAKCVKTASAFSKAATAYETRQTAIAGQIRDEAVRLGRLEGQLKALARTRNLPRNAVELHTNAGKSLATAKASGDGDDLRALMQAIGKLHTAVFQAEKDAKSRK